LDAANLWQTGVCSGGGRRGGGGSVERARGGGVDGSNGTQSRQRPWFTKAQT
jgi:hypothetical protein